ncbi:gliding motility lipoprotein GldB [Winogradskyella immobilis]|uniref:Gliding motility lipoprotein GldB n=1 Tax=Winogradskyella immobilis TaxID=2816852 RepID=A0ABS8EKZ7_9FLAO|nr:gliding motility lipoprotein GldB [Winogradskyella immobilis]MCC1483889.1 gliding motility lipoprotein GldB [Winogradskyella immobilis]MCG0015982.1 gliding motility lipoprotein GldB [Winogradskyella immobilis]
MRIQNYSITLVLLVLMSCNKDSALEKEIANVEVSFNVERFDKALAVATPKDLSTLKQTYPFLFSKRIPDSVWIGRFNDSLQKVLLNEVDKAFGDFKTETAELKGLFQHLKYYDKNYKTPRVITLTNDVDYRNKTIVNDSLVLIALDNYLGGDHPFYQNIQLYISERLSGDKIVSDIAEEYAKKYTYQQRRKTLLDEMIYFGKLLYFKDVMIPFKSDAEKIGYTTEDVEWAKVNENQIWSYFVEKEVLFSSESKLFGRFIAPAPFSKFYLQLDNESPGRLGQYIGWQIVRAYANRTGDDVFKILRTEPDDIFKNSKYKPRK